MNRKKKPWSNIEGLGDEGRLRTVFKGHPMTAYPTGKHFKELSDLYTGKLIMVIDTSGSMSPTRMTEAKKGARELLAAAIDESYIVGVVTFESSARVVLDLTTDLQKVDRALSGLSGGGGTDMSKGIRKAHDLLSARRGERVMAVFSDGGTNRASALAAASAAKNDDITILASLTGEADTSLMSEIVSAGQAVKLAEHGQIRSDIAGLATSLRPTWSQRA